MAKMIMMNELNKRANLLIEQLEVITFSLFSFSSSFLSKHAADVDGACRTSCLRCLMLHESRCGLDSILALGYMSVFAAPQSISSGFKQHLEGQLQGAIELCSQLEHVQNFITWAVAHHRRNPLLFSKELVRFHSTERILCQIESNGTRWRTCNTQKQNHCISLSQLCCTHHALKCKHRPVTSHHTHSGAWL